MLSGTVVNIFPRLGKKNKKKQKQRYTICDYQREPRVDSMLGVLSGVCRAKKENLASVRHGETSDK